MQSSSRSFVFVVVFAVSLGAQAAPNVDMNNPRRAVGREDDVRVDAELIHDTVASGSPITITYQIHNMTGSSVAVADKMCEASYDPDARTVTLSVGSEIPPDGTMPPMTVIGPEETKAFTAAAKLPAMLPATGNAHAAGPRYVRIKVSILRDLAPFQVLIGRQNAGGGARPSLDDEQFEKWLHSNETIFLNSIPVRYGARGRAAESDASQGHMSRSF